MRNIAYFTDLRNREWWPPIPHFEISELIRSNIFDRGGCRERNDFEKWMVKFETIIYRQQEYKPLPLGNSSRDIFLSKVPANVFEKCRAEVRNDARQKIDQCSKKRKLPFQFEQYSQLTSN